VTNNIQQLQETITELQASIDTAHRMMAQISSTIQDATPTETEQEEVVEETIELDSQLVSLISDVTQARIERMSEEYRNRIASVEKVNVSFELVLSSYFHDEEVDFIMEKLNFCRRINDFGHMGSVYSIYKDSPENREAMKAICAMYRLNVKNYKEDSTQSALYTDRSIVKYSTNCSDCGDLAKSIVDDLKSAGLTL
jgi:predicted TIM-barrel fold metal-dependent hydrolase